MDGRYEAEALLQPDLDYRREPFPQAGQGLRAVYPAARRILNRYRPDVLVTNNWGAIEWVASNLPPLVRHVHIEDGFGPEEVNSQMPRRVWFRRLVLPWQSTVVLPSLSLLRIARDIWRLPEKRLVYLPNGIDCAKFARGPDDVLAARISGVGPVIGTVAALRKEKALDRLIRAYAEVRRHQPARLAIVGEGEERPRLEALVAELGLGETVTFLGHIEQPETILGAFDVFALSSDTEQMPLTVLEAMAAGLPIATTDVGDVKHMLAEPNKASATMCEDGALARSILGLVSSPETARRIGAANQAKAVAEYDQAKMFSTYDRLFSGEL